MAASRVYAALRDVAFGSGTDISKTNTDVRFAPESGHSLSVSGFPRGGPSTKWE
jgi:hypothetical protein